MKNPGMGAPAYSHPARNRHRFAWRSPKDSAAKKMSSEKIRGENHGRLAKLLQSKESPRHRYMSKLERKSSRIISGHARTFRFPFKVMAQNSFADASPISSVMLPDGTHESWEPVRSGILQGACNLAQARARFLEVQNILLHQNLSGAVHICPESPHEMGNASHTQSQTSHSQTESSRITR